MRDREFRDRLAKKGPFLARSSDGFLDAYAPLALSLENLFPSFFLKRTLFRKRFQLAARETKPQRISTRENERVRMQIPTRNSAELFLSVGHAVNYLPNRDFYLTPFFYVVIFRRL